MQIHYFGFEKANRFNIVMTSYAPIPAVQGISNKTMSIVLLTEFILISGLYLALAMSGG